MPNLAMKMCSKCNECKPTSLFCKDSQKKDGLRSSCRTCHNRAGRKWHYENAERSRRNSRRWDKENKQARRDISELYRQEINTKSGVFAREKAFRHQVWHGVPHKA